MLFAVKTGAVATPEAFVVEVLMPPENVPLAPLVGAAKVTVTPGTGLFPESKTVTWSCVANADLMVALCGVPAVAEMFAGSLPTFVSEKLAGVPTPATDAVTIYGPPAVLFAVKTGAIAMPAALVVAVLTPAANVPLAPLAGGVNVTAAPLTGLLNESVTVARSCVTNAVLIEALCGVPALAVIAEAGPAVFVSEKAAAVATPETEAVTVYGPPAIVFAEYTAAVATPEAFVVPVLRPPANVPLAPLAGAVKVTVTPLTGLLKASLTVACNGVENAVFTVELCGVPATAVMAATAPAMLVREKFAVAATPETLAVTV